MALLSVENIKKNFGKTKVLKGISFSLNKGEVLAIIGSSGSGKTTLLRCLNFLEIPDEGTITVGDKLLIDGSNDATLSDEAIRQNRLHRSPMKPSGRTGSISVWCFRTSTCFPSTMCCRT